MNFSTLCTNLRTVQDFEVFFSKNTLFKLLSKYGPQWQTCFPGYYGLFVVYWLHHWVIVCTCEQIVFHLHKFPIVRSAQYSTDV